jgi:hypothetical protein
MRERDRQTFCIDPVCIDVGICAAIGDLFNRAVANFFYLDDAGTPGASTGGELWRRRSRSRSDVDGRRRRELDRCRTSGHCRGVRRDAKKLDPLFLTKDLLRAALSGCQACNRCL